MATQAIPGTYPASIPPTPADEAVQQPQYHEQQDQSHHHRQRNKLHKPNDPRGHSYTDSGVGFAESEPIQPANRNDDRWAGPSEAAGGGTYVREDTDPYRSSQPVQLPPSQQQQLTTQGIKEEFPIRKNDSDGQPAAAGAGAGVVGVGAAARKQTPPPSTVKNNDATPRQSHERNEAPYWGNLPKAFTGGIYNTVTGHGSANDDHDQHHHMPARGGVYNSVTGHGSQDEESRRHSQPTASDRAAMAGGSNGAPLAAPLGQVPEGQQKQTFTPSETNRSNDFDNAPRNDALLADPGATATNREVERSRQPQSGSPTRRAFPLAPSAMNAHEDESSKSNKHTSALAGTAAFGAGAMAYGIADKHQKDQKGTQPAPDESQIGHSKSTSEDQRHRSVGGLFSRKSRDERRASSVEKHRSRSRSVTGDKKHKVLGVFHRHKDDDAPREDTTTYEPPAQQDHKEEPILVSSGSTRTRNKLRKGSRSEPRDRQASTYENPTESDNSNHYKTRAATGAAAGAGALGLLHHRGDKDGKAPKDQANQQQPDPSFSSHPNQPPVGRSAQTSQPSRSGAGAAVGFDALELAHRHDPAHPAPGTATAAELATQKHDDPSTPFEHPREPPSPPRGNVGGSVPPAQLGLLASGAPRHPHEESTTKPTTHSTANTDVVYNTLPSGTPSGVQADSGLQPTKNSSRGLATHERGNNQRPAVSAPGDYNVFASSGNQFSPNTSSVPSSEANNTQRGSSIQQPAYNHLASSTPTGGQLGSSRASDPRGSRGGVVTQEPGNYNHLASGTVSGVTQDRSQPQSALTSETRPSQLGGATQEPGQYNHLSSGTASGVAAGIAAGGIAAGVASARNKDQPQHQSARGPEAVSSQQGKATQESGPHNHLASGTDSGVRRDSGFADSTGAHGTTTSGSSRPSQNRTDSGPYNKLASGTPSGVKIKPKDTSRRATEPAVHAHDQHGLDRNASLLTGPTGAVFTQHRQSQPTVDTRIKDLKDLPLPASSSSPTEAHTSSHHTVVSPPVHAPPETGKATNPPPPANQLATPRFTPFPNAEMMQGMSPEVMPDTYRESTAHPSGPREHKMSPEVMPAAYRDSVAQQDANKSHAI